MPGREIHDGCRNKERRDLARTAFHQRSVLALDDVESADTRADMHADVFRVLRRDLQAGHAHGFFRRRHRQVNEAAHLLYFFFLDEIQRVEIFDFGRDLAGVLGGVKLSDPADAAFARQQVPPDLISFVADRADQADPGHDNSSHQLLPRFRVLADVIDRVLDGADFFRVLVGDFDLESFFERHD